MSSPTSYEAPAIVERTPIDLPLIGGAGSGVLSGVFRTMPVYAAPAIAERTRLAPALVLIAN